MEQPLATRLGAEAVGTFLFFFLGFSGIAVVVDIGPDAITPLGVAAGFGFGLALARPRSASAQVMGSTSSEPILRPIIATSSSCVAAWPGFHRVL